MGLTVAHDLSDDLDLREALYQQAQRFLELNERDRPSQAQMTPRAEIENRPRPLARDLELVRRFEHGPAANSCPIPARARSDTGDRENESTKGRADQRPRLPHERRFLGSARKNDPPKPAPGNAQWSPPVPTAQGGRAGKRPTQRASRPAKRYPFITPRALEWFDFLRKIPYLIGGRTRTRTLDPLI